MARGIIPPGLGLRSDEGHPSAPPAAEGEPAPAVEEQAPDPEAPKAPEVDWKAEARKHEKRAKENAKAAEELEKLRASQMSEQEKAVAAAKAEGMAEANKAAGVKIAASELKSAAKDKGLDLSKVQEWIKVESFVDDNGDVDSKAITKAVAAFAEVAPAPAPGRSGAPIPGGSSSKPNTSPTLDSAVAARYGM
jgi:hypothetical protein